MPVRVPRANPPCLNCGNHGFAHGVMIVDRAGRVFCSADCGWSFLIRRSDAQARATPSASQGPLPVSQLPVQLQAPPLNTTDLGHASAHLAPGVGSVVANDDSEANGIVAVQSSPSIAVVARIGNPCSPRASDAKGPNASSPSNHTLSLHPPASYLGQTPSPLTSSTPSDNNPAGDTARSAPNNPSRTRLRYYPGNVSLPSDVATFAAHVDLEFQVEALSHSSRDSSCISSILNVEARRHMPSDMDNSVCWRLRHIGSDATLSQPRLKAGNRVAPKPISARKPPLPVPASEPYIKRASYNAMFEYHSSHLSFD